MKDIKRKKETRKVELLFFIFSKNYDKLSILSSTNKLTKLVLYKIKIILENIYELLIFSKVISKKYSINDAPFESLLFSSKIFYPEGALIFSSTSLFIFINEFVLNLLFRFKLFSF